MEKNAIEIIIATVLLILTVILSYGNSFTHVDGISIETGRAIGDMFESSIFITNLIMFFLIIFAPYMIILFIVDKVKKEKFFDAKWKMIAVILILSLIVALLFMWIVNLQICQDGTVSIFKSPPACPTF